jgi:hypothetical protein
LQKIYRERTYFYKRLLTVLPTLLYFPYRIIPPYLY